LVMLNPAAPPPLIINLISFGDFFINFREFNTATPVTIAVPC
jgi:hypothetical protein